VHLAWFKNSQLWVTEANGIHPPDVRESKSWTEREGRLLKLLSGVMMLELGLLLLLAPERLSQVGVAFALMGLALGITWIAARATRNRE